LVIAATALISAINALTLKPTQCALWLRPVTPPEQRNIVYRVFNRAYEAGERAYTGLVRRLVHASTVVATVCVALVAFAVFSLSRV
ncbi:efflux RND transporter permease subunit, partial [Vibrio parahaemolyticus]